MANIEVNSSKYLIPTLPTPQEFLRNNCTQEQLQKLVKQARRKLKPLYQLG